MDELHPKRIRRRYAIRMAIGGAVLGLLVCVVVMAKSGTPSLTVELLSRLAGTVAVFAALGFVTAHQFFAKYDVRAERQRADYDVGTQKPD